MWKSIFFSAALTLAVSQAAVADSFDGPKFAALTPGLTKDQVIAAVGEPLQRWSADQVFVYRSFGPEIAPGKPAIDVVTVFFGSDQKLSKVEYWSNRPKPAAAAPNP